LQTGFTSWIQLPDSFCAVRRQGCKRENGTAHDYFVACLLLTDTERKSVLCGATHLCNTSSKLPYSIQTLSQLRNRSWIPREGISGYFRTLPQLSKNASMCHRLVRWRSSMPRVARTFTGAKQYHRARRWCQTCLPCTTVGILCGPRPLHAGKITLLCLRKIRASSST